MTDYSEIFPDAPQLLARKFYVDPVASLNVTVPAGATYARISCLGCGGQSTEAQGGGGAFARSVVPVTPGETLNVRVGDTSTASTNGDSYVRRSATYLCYADRGRGNGNAGLAANSVGDVTRNGQTASTSTSYPDRYGGQSATDAGDFGELGFGKRPAGGHYSWIGAAPGGGGVQFYAERVYSGYTRHHAGCGLVAIEYFDKDPGY